MAAAIVLVRPGMVGNSPGCSIRVAANRCDRPRRSVQLPVNCTRVNETCDRCGENKRERERERAKCLSVAISFVSGRLNNRLKCMLCGQPVSIYSRQRLRQNQLIVGGGRENVCVCVRERVSALESEEETRTN